MTVNLFAIAGAVSQVFVIPRSAISGHGREYDVVQARFASAYLMKHMRPDVTLERIGALLGRRDHTTVINAIRQGAKLVQLNAAFASLVEDAREIAVAWRVGQPLPGFYAGQPIPQPVKLESLPAVKIKPPRRVDEIRTLGGQFHSDYADADWYSKNDRRFVGAMMIAHPERYVGRAEAAE